jgi:GNAT superfamily N-acetyltransferase
VIRAATAGDLPGVRRVADEHDNLANWPEPPDYLDAELAYGRLAVAEEDGVVLGFAGTVRRGPVTYLADLFLTAGAQSRGLGRGLLEHALAGCDEIVTFASADTRAWARYLAAGMRPRHPLVYLAGRLADRPDAQASADCDQAAEPDAPAGADLDLAVELDAAASGGAREQVLRWFAARPGVSVHTVGGSYAFARTVNGKVIIGPAAGEPAIVAAIRAAGDRDLQLSLLGPHPLLPRLVRAGLRITYRDTFMSTATPFDPEHYVPNVSIG